MRKIEHEQGPTLKYKSGKTSMATTAVLEDWEPATVLCPKCGGKHTAFNKLCGLTTFPEQYQYICSDCGHRWTNFKANSIGPTQSWPILEYEEPTPVGQMGWICPKCGGVFAPHMDYCTNCTQPKVPQITYCGTGIETVSTTNKSNTAITRNYIDETSIATFGNVSENSNGNKSNT